MENPYQGNLGLGMGLGVRVKSDPHFSVLVCACFLLGKGWLSNACTELSDPLNQLNAILPLLHYRALSAIESAIGRPYLVLSRIHAQVGVLNRLVLNRLGGSTAR